MASNPSLQLFDPRNGDLALKVDTFNNADGFSAPQRTNYFTVFWVQDGSGDFWADLAQHRFGANSLLFLVPYQCFRLMPKGRINGVALHFHANFLCIETHHEEVGCNGVLFNDVYGVPILQLDDAHADDFSQLFTDMTRELQDGGVAQSQVLLSYLKIFLVRATRLKLQGGDMPRDAGGRPPDVISELKELIEKNFRTRHAPGDYADLLAMAPKSLARLVKIHLHKTLTELIRERIILQARWELLHTRKAVKQVSAELGFDDVFYFSRLFKRATGCSPRFFREHETAIRGGRNLSMQ